MWCEVWLIVWMDGKFCFSSVLLVIILICVLCVLVSLCVVFFSCCGFMFLVGVLI